MYLHEIKKYLLSAKEVQRFPLVADIINRHAPDDKMAVWDYAFISCQAVGKPPLTALPVAAACYCMIASIHLVDDLLDNDPNGDYHTLGAGTCANLAVAFQAIGTTILNGADIPTEYRSGLVNEFSCMMHHTAHAQQMDINASGDEAIYWQIAKAKSPPLFGAALFGGCLSGSGSLDLALQVKELAMPLGTMIQISDDIYDVMQPAVNADWISKNNNLAILYAMNSEHPFRQEFLDLLKDISSGENLKRAQYIIIKSGALSYCLYHLTELNETACRMIRGLNVVEQKHLQAIADYLIKPAFQLLSKRGWKSSVLG